jgi:hypothetical protein
MLTLKPAARSHRAVLLGPPEAPTGAAVLVVDKIKIVKCTIDFQNSVVLAHLERGGLLDDGTFMGTGEVETVQLDTQQGHNDSRRRNAFGQLLSGNGSDLTKALDAIEKTIRRGAFIEGVQRQQNDPEPQ